MRIIARELVCCCTYTIVASLIVHMISSWYKMETERYERYEHCVRSSSIPALYSTFSLSLSFNLPLLLYTIQQIIKKVHRLQLIIYCSDPHPSKHEKLNQCWINVGPPSATLDQHCPSIVTVCDAGPTLTQHCFSVSSLPG